jgi:hypothetical protein
MQLDSVGSLFVSPGAATLSASNLRVFERRTGPRFGSYLVWDVGASDPVSGTAKGRFFSDSGQVLLDLPTRKIAPNGVADPTEFVKELGARSAEALKSVADKLKADPLSQVIIFAPGVMRGTVNKILQNIKTKSGKPLENIDFAPLATYLKDFGPSDKPKPIQVMLANDMVGAASATVAAMQKHPELNKSLNTDGFKALLAMLGGGLGVIEIQRHEGAITLNATEGGHILPLHNNLFPRGKAVLEEESTSSRAFMRNLSRRLGLPEEPMVRAADVRLAMGDTVELPGTHQSLRFLERTGKFEMTPAPGNTMKVRMSESPEKIQAACMGAIQDTIRGLAQVGHQEVVKGTNAFVLFGPMVKTIDKFLKDNQDVARRVFGVSRHDEVSFKSLLSGMIDAQLNKAGESMKDSSGFHVITDLEIPHNAVGGSVFRNAKPIGPWAYRYRIPLSSSDSAKLSAT